MALIVLEAAAVFVAAPSAGRAAALLVALLAGLALFARVWIVWFLFVAGLAVLLIIDVLMARAWYEFASAAIGLGLLLWPTTRRYMYDGSEGGS